MTRIFTALAASVFAMLAASCCCTGEPKPPGLRPLPQFREIPSAQDQGPQIHNEK
jgi:hypothetical protein